MSIREPQRDLDARIASLTELMRVASNALNNQLTVIVGLLALIEADLDELKHVIGEARSDAIRTDLGAMSVAAAEVSRVSRGLAAASLGDSR